VGERLRRLRAGVRGPVVFGDDDEEDRPDDGPERARARGAWAEIDLAAVRANTRALRALVAPALPCAVVKADAYGHGAVEVARAALAGGAAGLAVAIVSEGLELRRAAIDAPILLLSEPPGDAMGAAVAAGLEMTVSSAPGIAAVIEAAKDEGRQAKVHLKVDTGMHRVGAAPDEAAALARQIADAGLVLSFEGLWTHLAVADGGSGEDRTFTRGQLERFDQVAAELSAAGSTPPLLHAANSAGAVAWPESRYQMVRVGIALYGELPPGAVAEAYAASGAPALRPVLSFKATVSAVRELAAGERPSYGRLRPLPERSVVATVPVGYADGVPRAALAGGLEVLVGGRRRPLAGMVTMDQLMIDCGPPDRAHPVAPGDEVVLLGRQGDETVSATEWAERLGTISYEVLCGIGPRVPRVTVGATPSGGLTADPRMAGERGRA
jgi:alanine racemase